LSANYLFNNNSLSKDRWEIYEIKNKVLGKKNDLLKKQKVNQKIKK